MENKVLQRGRSMVEMMGYMAVVLAIAASIGTLIGHVYDEFRYSKASLQVSELAAAIVKASSVEGYNIIIGEQPGDDKVSEKVIKLLPKSFRVVGQAAYHAFGGKVTVAALSDARFSITFSKLNRKQCIELAMKEWQNNRTVDLFEIAINNHYWYWDIYGNGNEENGDEGDEGDESAEDNRLPVRRSVVAGKEEGTPGQCIDGKTNSITWIFN